MCHEESMLYVSVLCAYANYWYFLISLIGEDGDLHVTEFRRLGFSLQVPKEYYFGRFHLFLLVYYYQLPFFSLLLHCLFCSLLF